MNTVKQVLFPSRWGKETALAVKTAHWLINALALLLWSAGLGVVSLYFARVTYDMTVFVSYFRHGLLLLLNMLPVFLFTAFFWLLTNRIWAAFLGSALLTLIPSLINHFKILLRSDPLLASDIYVATEAANISEQYTFHFGPAIWLTLIAVVLGVVLSALLLKARLPKKGPRFLALTLTVALGAVLYMTVYRSYAVYQKTENLDIYTEDRVLSPWSAADQYVTRGFLYPLLYSTVGMSSGKPDDYDRDQAQADLESYVSGDIPADQKVSVISIMLEAYNDFSKFGLEFETDPYAFFHELQAESVSGSLVTNIFAGGTIDTERGYITGNTTLPEYRSASGSFVRYFNDQGYYTEFCHPGYNWFYNRLNVMDYFGFQETNFYEDHYTLPEDYGLLNDVGFLPDLINLHEAAVARGTPYFNFSVTYQNHGPYADGYLYDENTVYAKRTEGMTDAGYNILSNYLWGIRETDMALEKLVDHFRASEEPVILVLFGDHNPWLGDGGYVYEEFGVDFSGEDGFYDYYSTPYVIWANDAAKEALGRDFVGEGQTVSPCYLMTLLFDEAGWTGDSYLNALRQLRETMPIINTGVGKVLENGVMTVPSESARAQLDHHRQMEYYRRRDMDYTGGGST